MRGFKREQLLCAYKDLPVQKNPITGDFEGKELISTSYFEGDLISPDGDVKIARTGVCFTDATVCGNFGTEFCKICPHRGDLYE